MAITVALIAVGQMLGSGRGPLADAAFAVVGGWVAIGVIAGVLLFFARVVRGIPPRLRALGFAAIVVVGVFLALAAGPGGYVIAAVFIVAGALVGAGVAAMVRRPSKRRRLAVAAVGLLIGVSGVVAVPAWFAWGGAEPDAASVNPEGQHVGAALSYGSGQHPHRPEFGADVDVVTATVDGTAFLANWSGWRGTLRTNYWGFGPGELPLNARVWLPESGEPGPLVLIVHGNHVMEVASDEGYAWLAEDLAARGYVVASIDQNFLNLSTTRGLDLGDENDARAWLLLEHLRLWRAWQDDPDSPLHGTVDLDRIALIGHSRGGEAVAHAAHFDRLERYPEDATVAFDARFGIDAVIAIAPIDGQYQPAGRSTPLHDVSYLALHGGRDGDVSSFDGLRQYARTTFSGHTFAAKAAIYLEDANHGQFNTVWGRRDWPGAAGRTLETATLVPGEDQRRDAQAAIVALLDASLRDDPSGLALLRDGTDPGWSGATRVIARYEDSTELLVADFDEDLDPATASLPGAELTGEGLAIWREEPAPLRWGEQDTNGVVLGWDHQTSSLPPSFTVRLPTGIELPSDPVLILDVADPGATVADLDRGDGPLDLTIEVRDANGNQLRTPIADHGGVPPAPTPRRLKTPLPDVIPATEAISTTIRIPLSRDIAVGAEVREIRLVFDRIPTGVVRIDRIALGSR